MEFRIADTFTDSLSRLTTDEQKAVKTTAFDLQMNPANPGMQLHRIDRARDKSFWSIRVNADVRLILHKSESSLLLCYVNHHDKAYQWAERRKMEVHPKTGAAQLVEIRETVKEIVVPKYVESTTKETQTKPPLFSHLSEEELLGFGVPKDWVADVHKANEDSVLELADHLPGEAVEALLNIATGTSPVAPVQVPTGADPFNHPDAQRRFRIVTGTEELERALEYPWEKWIIFLHPSQRELVERSNTGPTRVSGSAGTGKTIVAIHRAAYLARTNQDARVLLTTFSDTLANSLRSKLRRLISNEPHIGERLEVHSLSSIGRRLYEANVGKLILVSSEAITKAIKVASEKVKGHKFSHHFLLSEWSQVVDAWQVQSWEAYRDVPRLGRKTRLSEKQRLTLWTIFVSLRNDLKEQGALTEAEMFTRLAKRIDEMKRKPFEFTIIDEAQDVNVPQLRFLAALGANSPNGLFFAGDLGQRIFQQAFSWKSLGVDIRGRSRTLRINYRTSHQIRMQADRLLGPELSDVDGIAENRRGTISVFNGPSPSVFVCKTPKEESEKVAKWMLALAKRGLKPHEIGVFVRSAAGIERARNALNEAKLPFKVLDEHIDTTVGYASLCTMHLAKGLEFRAVAVMACDDEIIPSQERIESVSDESDLEEVFNTERHLLYVACTRARDELILSGVQPGSEFLEDLKDT